MHKKLVSKHFEMKDSDEYHDLYGQSDTLLQADVFNNFRNMCFDPAFFSAPGLAWQGALKRNKVNLDLLTDIDMLLLVEKVIRGVICHAIYQYGKADNIDYDKNRESSYVNDWYVNNLCG